MLVEATAAPVRPRDPARVPLHLSRPTREPLNEIKSKASHSRPILLEGHYGVLSCYCDLFACLHSVERLRLAVHPEGHVHAGGMAASAPSNDAVEDEVGRRL